ncbi:MAG: hypothetical protein RL702_3060 [Pseudomonadota bacterium]
MRDCRLWFAVDRMGEIEAGGRKQRAREAARLAGSRRESEPVLPALIKLSPRSAQTSGRSEPIRPRARGGPIRLCLHEEVDAPCPGRNARQAWRLFSAHEHACMAPTAGLCRQDLQSMLRPPCEIRYCLCAAASASTIQPRCTSLRIFLPHLLHVETQSIPSWRAWWRLRLCWPIRHKILLIIGMAPGLRI